MFFCLFKWLCIDCKNTVLFDAINHLQGFGISINTEQQQKNVHRKKPRAKFSHRKSKRAKNTDESNTVNAYVLCIVPSPNTDDVTFTWESGRGEKA